MGRHAPVWASLDPTLRTAALLYLQNIQTALITQQQEKITQSKNGLKT